MHKMVKCPILKPRRKLVHCGLAPPTAILAVDA
jgi:hypothetical protein